AFRIIVDKVSDCYNILGYIHDIFQAIPGRLKDYIAVPKPNMYQSLHTTVSHHGHFFEVQIRTKEMHRIAELGIAAHWKYKSGGISDSSVDEKLSWVRKLLEVQTDVSEADDFMKTFKIDLFSDQVFVSTPKGDIIKLPADSNIIDFAYSIHSAVGNKMIGGKVNGRMSELSTKLQNGDVVEIITSQSSSGPSRDWLNIVRTNEAKAKIRQWFKKEKREENIEAGRDVLEKELRRLNVYLVNVDKNTFFQPIMKRYGLTELDEFYAAIGYGGISVSKILPKLKEEYIRLQKQNEKPKTVEITTKRKAINGVIVEDLDNCLVRLAGCCSPLPGDEIISYITRGNGVSVHKADCKHMQNVDGNRLIRVHWDGAPSDYFATTICVTALSRIDLVADITMVLASMRIVMHSINTHELSDGCIEVFLNIDVMDLSHLDTVMKRINKINNVMTVERAPEKGKKK
ncbi:MAG: bifunctional (p)ppGpp synthetase/guanosine-3',5'-bis(diphosphate) 3'-pyrophosphohydrolase, partial [Clostridia bacterium]|nr:bifunctional (p)ppGpp synthetase/guanosine-3',5'-bis(diphosphate) 3'-pyrophosphohydrolase [Clostridia bacterium]